MTIASEISRLQTAKADIKTSIEGKGVTVPSSAKLDSYDDYIDQIQSGGGGGIGSSATTMTVTWTETSNPAQFNPVYSDDATGLTAGSPEFDAFFGYSAVKLDSNGIETARVTQGSTPGELDITQLGTLTSGDNVMIKFPVRGIKMTKSGSQVTLSITKELNKKGYQYYAFTRNGTIKNNLYLGAFKGYRSSGVLKSWSGKKNASSGNGDGCNYMGLMTNGSNVGARPAAQANGSNWDEITWYARNYVDALYMMKYGNGNGQTTIGQGFSNGGQTGWTTGNSWTQSGNNDATWGGTNTQQMRLFGLEDRWGAVLEWLDGAYYSSVRNLRVSTSNVFTNTTWDASTFDIDVPINSASGTYLKGISGTNEGMFAGLDIRGSDSTYYCDYFAVSSGSGLLAGGYWSFGSIIGPFCVFQNSVSNADSYYGARLMFLGDPQELKSYEEIVAMATAEGQPRSNTVSELNLNPSEYYTMLNEGNHLSEGDAGETVYYITGIEYGGNMEKLVIVMEQNRAYTTYVMD